MLEQSQNTLFDVQESVSQTLSRRAFRANPSQLRGSVRALVTSVICGPKLRESFARLGQDGSWEKTSEGSLALMMEECSEPFSGTWPSWGIASGGHATEQTKPQELHNAGTESLLLDTWPTPQASDIHFRQKSANWQGHDLPSAAHEWPRSPQAQENSTNGQESSMPDQTSPPRSRPTKRLNYRFSLWLMGFPEDWL